MRRREFLGALASIPLAGRWRIPHREPVLVERWTWAMGQAVRLRLFVEDEAFGLEAAQSAFREVRRVESLLSRFDDASALSEANRRAGRGPWAAPPELVAVLRSAAWLRAETRGAFDVAVEPLMQVWGFRAPRVSAPTAAEMAAAGAAVRAAEVRLGGGRLDLPASHTRLDLGGIGVGYALDRAALVLRSRGVRVALLEISGDVIALGSPPGTPGWLVELVGPGGEPGASAVPLLDCALATSAARGTVVRVGGRERGHLMVPWQGAAEPVLRQATVVARSGMLADALSTAAVVNGRVTPGAVWHRMVS